MTRDFKVTAAAVQLVVEQFGSVTHLAWALGVSKADLDAWRSGTAEVPPDVYEKMVELVANTPRKTPR